MDIHVGEIQKTGPQKGRATLYFHITINDPVTGIVPTPVSAISEHLEQVERDQLAAGTKIEYVSNIGLENSIDIQDMKAAVINQYNNVVTKVNQDYNTKYKFWGQQFNAN